MATCVGIVADFVGPDGVEGGRLARAEHEGVLRAFPRLGMREGVRAIMCHMRRTKAGTTFDSFVGVVWGEVCGGV